MDQNENVTPATPIPPSDKKRWLVFAAIAVVVVALVAVLALTLRGSGSPAGQFVDYQDELMIDPVFSSLEKSLDAYGSGSFSSDLTISASVDNREIDRYLKDSSLLLKLDVKPDQLLANGELHVMGTPLVSGDLLYQKGKLELYSPEAGDSRYVMDLSKMISSMSGEEVDLSELKLPKFSGKEWRSVAESYWKLLCSAVTADSIETEKDVSFKLAELGGSYTGTTLTFTPRAEDVEAMLVKLADQLENDKTLRKLIVQAVNPDMLSNAFGAEWLEDGSFEESLDEGLTETAGNLRDNAADLAEAAEDAFTWTLYLEGKEVRMIRIAGRDSEDALVVECSGTESTGRATAIYMDSSDSDYRLFTIVNEYTKKGKTYEGEFSYTSPHDGTISCAYELDTGKKSALGIPYGTYNMDVSHDNISVDLEVGKGDKGGTDHVLTIRGGEYVFDDFSRLEITVNSTDRSSAKKPGGKTVDITDYSEEEFADLLDEVGTNFSDNLMDKMESLNLD